MEFSLEEEGSAKRKKGVRIAAALFVIGMLALTFFSNTYQALSLPKVQTETPSLGALSYEIEGSGTLKPHDEVDLYDRSGWTVKKVNAEEGDRVKKGQVLVELDTESAERNLMDEKARYDKLELQLATLQDNLKETAARQDASAIDKAKRDIEALQDDMAIQRRNIEGLEQDLREQAQVRAPFDGIVTEIHAVEDLPDSPGQPVAVVANVTKGFDLTVTVSDDKAAHVAIGKTVNVSLQGARPRIVKAAVTKLEDAAASGAQAGDSGGGGKRMTLTVMDSGLEGGEFGLFDWVENGGERNVLVPTDAVHRDDRGDYVFVLKEVKKPLGNDYYVQAAYVQTGDSDDDSTAVLSGLTPMDKIVTDSSDPLSDGDRVRIN